MQQQQALTGPHLRTPKAAAVAGIVFSVLLIIIFFLFRSAVPADPFETGAWLEHSSRNTALALDLIPFAGVAFLWFIGSVRDRLGQLEDRFFATVFFGSALLFLTMLFVAAAAMGAVILVAGANQPVDSESLQLVRAFAYIVMNTYAVKMAAVFMISTSTVIIFTGIAPRWIAVVGFILALVLLLGSSYLAWSFIVLPFWVLLVSAFIIIDNLFATRAGSAL
jgi:hypothetical protein